MTRRTRLDGYGKDGTRARVKPSEPRSAVTCDASRGRCDAAGAAENAGKSRESDRHGRCSRAMRRPIQGAHLDKESP